MLPWTERGHLDADDIADRLAAPLGSSGPPELLPELALVVIRRVWDEAHARLDNVA